MPSNKIQPISSILKYTKRGSDTDISGDKASQEQPPKKPKPYNRDSHRTLNPAWFKEFDWLRFDENENIFTCSICREHHKHNIFTTGKSAAKPKKDDFVKHQITTDHR